MKFGKLHDPDELSRVDFQLPTVPNRSIELIHAKTEGKPFRAYIGCPMWDNKGWIGKLYPKGSKAGEYLRYYARSFNGIELNSTHYRTPKHEIVSRWRDMAGEDFHFSPKISQTISHRFRLVNCQDQLDRFCESIEGFRSSLGCSFIQLPPNFTTAELPKLDWFLATWPQHLPLAVEFRHASWFEGGGLSADVLDLLEGTNTTALITDVAGRRDVLHAHLTTSTVMIRFVGNGLVPTDYTRADAWLDRIEAWVNQGLEALYFFVHEPDDTFAPEMGTYIIEGLNKRLGLDLPIPGLHDAPGAQMSLF